MVGLLTFFILVLLQSICKCTIQATLYVCNKNAPCGCSRHNVHWNSAVIGSESVVGHSWGWAVSLRVTKGELHFCTGAILSEDYVLTAAHCLTHPEIRDFPLTVAAGIDTLAEEKAVKRTVSEILLHPEWNPKTNINDIAILRVDRPINLTHPNLARLCLPSLNKLRTSAFPPPRTSLVAIGWGYSMFDDVESDFLQQMKLEVLDEELSKQMNPNYNPDLQFCATVQGEGTDLQAGDSGGPIMYFSEKDRQWTIAGITTFGNSCGTDSHVGVYTRVSMYMDWIESKVGPRGVVYLGKQRRNSDTNTTSRLFERQDVNSGVIRAHVTIHSSIVLFCLFSIMLFICDC